MSLLTAPGRNRLQIFVAVVFALGLIGLWTSLVTDRPDPDDPAQNLQQAINLERAGVFSDNEIPPLEPSMQREPFPIVVDALMIRAVDGVMGAADNSAYFSGERLRLLKLQNVFWLLILSCAVFAGARMLTLPFCGALLCVALTNLLLLNDEVRYYWLNSLYTEAPATALLMLASLFLAAGLVDRKPVSVILAGFLFGLLALVKAAFLYIAPGVAVLALALLWRQRRSTAQALLAPALLCAVFTLTVSPWLQRNYASFGLFKIAGRGGVMLYTRGIMDEQMSWDEYVGGYYFWAPYPLNAVLRRALGYSRHEEDRGGRLQRLNDFRGSNFFDADLAATRAGRPQDVINFYLQGEAESSRVLSELTRKGDRAPKFHADAQLQSRGMELIRAHPGMELVLWPLFLWRGAFFTFPALAVAFAWSVKRGEHRLALLVLPALAMVCFYGLVSFLIPRYSQPAAPVALLAAVALCVRLYRRRGNPVAAPAARSTVVVVRGTSDGPNVTSE